MLVSAAKFLFRMRNHAFFFRSSFLLFEFDFLGILGIVFRLMVFFRDAQSCCLRYGICFGKAALLRVAGREFILRLGNVFGDGAGFVFGELRVSVLFVMFRFERCSSFARIERNMAKGCCGSLDVGVWRGHGVYFRSGGHEWRERRETNCVRNWRIVEWLRLRFHRFRRKVLMRFPF